MNTPLEKQVHEMVKLAKKVGNEAEFQKKAQYKKFKAKQNEHQRQLRILANELHSLNFHEECIYWSHKAFEDLRISDKEERHSVFNALMFSYYNLKNYEKTLEYGQKSLDLELKKPLTQTIDTLDAMRVSASKIKRYQDASRYAKEVLKINIVRYNEKEIQKPGLLISYSNLIDVQVKEENIIGAKKTIKRLKLFNLNSMDPNDVWVSMEKEGYKKQLPLNDYISDETCFSEHTLVEFGKKNFSNCDDLKEFILNLQMYHSVGKICWMKFLIYRRFDGKQNCEQWGLLHLSMLHDILVHMHALVSVEIVNLDFEKLQKSSHWILPYKHYMLEMVNCSLRLANDVPLKRGDLYYQLCFTFGISKGNPRNFIAETVRKYPINVLQEVMPFIQYYIKCALSQEEINKNDSQVVAEYQKRREQMFTLKNSLIIMNHFKTFSIRYADEL